MKSNSYTNIRKSVVVHEHACHVHELVALDPARATVDVT